MLADGRARATVFVRVRYALADLVSVLVIVRRPDGSQHNSGLLSIPLDDWHDTLRPTFASGVASGSVVLDDDTRPRCGGHDS